MARYRTPRDTRRKERTRTVGKRVLIVCEGEKTETSYFQGLAHCYRLKGVKVVGTGSDPSALVKEAQKRKRSAELQGDGYDQVYCVFDQDEHQHFDTATRDASFKKMIVARSWPCFEYWFLLHFCYTRQPFVRQGNRSPCDMCTKALKAENCLPTYEKNQAGMFELLQDRLETALSRATQAAQEATKENNSNPSTEIHCLVRYLQGLAK